MTRLEPRWIVGHTKPSQEARAALNLRRQALEIYLPLFFDKAANRRKPLFSRYIFVRESGGVCFILRNSFGMSGPVAMADQPATVDNAVIEELRKRERHGLVELPDHGETFLRNQAVRIKEGPFSGLSGLYQGQSSHERVKVLLSFMGAETVCNVDVRSLEAA